MSPEYTVEAADGFYIARNGEGVLDLADPQDYEFAEFVCAALNHAAQQKLHPTPESLASSQAVTNAENFSQSDGESKPAQARVS